MRLYQLTCW